MDSDDLDDDDDNDDDDEDEEEEKEEGSTGHDERNGTETLDSLRGYMDQMDSELMGTNIGKSFNPTVRFQTLNIKFLPQLCLNIIFNKKYVK